MTGLALRTGRISSRISARVDLAFRLRGQEDEPLINMTHIVPIDVTWSRNKPAEADTCDISISRSDLPFDPRIIAPRGGLVFVWLFEHGDIDACKYDDPGLFGGPIDEIKRSLEDGKISIRARDFTSILLDATLGEGVLAKIPVERALSLADVVRATVNSVSDIDTWQIEELTPSAGARVGSPAVRPRERSKSKTGRVSRAPKSILSARFKTMASVNAKQGQVSAWDAVSAVCARMGVVPEVTIDRLGRPKIQLIAADELNTSAILRPFKRGNRPFRTLTVGGDVETLDDTIDLSPHEKRPDFVAVASIDRETGLSVAAEFPSRADRRRTDKSENGLYQTIEGIGTVEGCEKIARSAWESLSQNEFTMTIASPHPWSTGGSPDDPDLLDLGYGAALAVDYEGFEQLANRSPSDILRDQGLPAVIAARIARAQTELGRLSLLFLVVSVEHSWTGGNQPSYKCSISVRQALNGQVV